MVGRDIKFDFSNSSELEQLAVEFLARHIAFMKTVLFKHDLTFNRMAWKNVGGCHLAFHLVSRNSWEI